MKLRIGVDFDNTIIDYRALFHALASERAWLPAGFPAAKELIRSHLMKVDGDDLRWQRLQADAYGHRIREAVAFEGALDFLRKWKADGHEIWIVSHKSETSHLDPSVKLRDAARTWMKANDLGDTPIFFASTREEKIEKIRALALDLFIDDLAEVLEDPSFPASTAPLWFTQGAPTELIPESSLIPARDWKNVDRLVELATDTDPEVLRAFIRKFGEIPQEAAVLKRSGNNRIVMISGEERMVMKKSSPAREGERDKSLIEFHAVSLLWENGFRSVPEPIFHDPVKNLALYSHVPGKVLSGSEITKDDVHGAANFLLRLKKLGDTGIGNNFGEAADSRRMLGDYITLIEKRIDRVSEGSRTGPRGPEVATLLKDDLLPFWKKLKTRFVTACEAEGLALQSPFSDSSRILSPSDFGFHNCLVDHDPKTGKNTLTFVDFEYFGWDDPAKLVSDFFHSVAQEVPWERKWEFLDHFVAGLTESKEFMRRWERVLDLIGFEWVLIVLNVAVPEIMQRRIFADPSIDASKLMGARLEKARELLNRFNSAPAGSRFITVPNRSANH
jgi:hypothetical protein